MVVEVDRGWLLRVDRRWTYTATFNHVISQFERPLKRRLKMVPSLKSHTNDSTPVRVCNVQEGAPTARNEHLT